MKYLRNRKTGVIHIGCADSNPKLAAHPDMVPWTSPAPSPTPAAAIPAAALPVTVTASSDDRAPLQTLSLEQVNSLRKDDVIAYLGTAYDPESHFMTSKNQVKKLWKEQTGQ